MDEKYWETRDNGLYKNNPNREHFVKREGALDIPAFEAFISEHKFVFPDAYISFLKKYNGLETDKKLYFRFVSDTKVDVIVPLVLPFGQAVKEFEVLRGHPKVKENYFPVAETTSAYMTIMLKVKGRNKGKIYFFDGIRHMIDMIADYEDIKDFFGALEISIE
jgi:hypothetical protein